MAKKTEELSDPRVWIKDLDIETTADIAIPKMLVDQVIGQEQGVEIVRKAAEQKRHVMLIGYMVVKDHHQNLLGGLDWPQNSAGQPEDLFQSSQDLNF